MIVARCLLSLLTLTGVVATAACSAEDLLGAPSPSPSSSAPPPAVGTITPTVPVEGAEALGLELATVHATVDPQLFHVAPGGLTYATSQADEPALQVSHLAWDGTQSVTTNISAPDPAYVPQLSYDDALGAVGFWFTAEAPQEAAAAVVGSPITWFDTATGATGTQTIEVPQGGETLGTPRMLGGLTHGPAYLSASYLTPEWEPGTFSLFDAGITSASTDTQGGQVVARVTAEDGTATLYLGDQQILTGLTESTTTIPRAEGYLVTDWDTAKVWVIRDGKAEEIDTSGCILEPGIKATSSANGYLFVGQLLISPELEANCLTPRLSSDAYIDGVLSDGSALIRTTRPSDGVTVDYSMMSADGSSAIELGAVAQIITVGGHLVFQHGPNREYVTAFSEKDLRLPES